MAVYTRVDEASLTTFLSGYGLPPATVFKGIAEGVENSNYLLESGGTRYILTLYEKRVEADDLPYFLDLMDHVVMKGVPAAAPVRDQKGQCLQQLCGRPAALIHFIEGTSPDDAAVRQANQAGQAMAQLHTATADFHDIRENSLGPEGWLNLIHEMGAGLNQVEAGLHQDLLTIAMDLADRWPRTLPRGTIHADLFPDNILFKDGKVGGLIDFYFSCTDFYAYDLAISMNAWTPEGTTAPAHAKSLLDGYQAVRPLSAEECAALPLFLQGSALRFLLTRAYDWLNQVPGSLVRVKDPLPYLTLLRHHRATPTAFLDS